MKKSGFANFLIIVIFLILLVLLYKASGAVFDSRINDVLINTVSKINKKYADEKIVLVTVDDKSLDKYPSPRSRDKFAEIFDFLGNKAGAKVIVFNNLVIFPDTYNKESDEKFFETVKNSKNLINSYLFVNSNILDDVIPPDYVNIFDKKSNCRIEDKRTKKNDFSYNGVLKLPKEFLENAEYLAYSMLIEDDDGFSRTYMPVSMFNGRFYPSIALSAYAAYTGQSNFILKDGYLCSADNCKTLKMPVHFKKIKDSAGNKVNGLITYFNWKTPLNKHYSHKNFSAVSVSEGKVSPDEFKDKIVIIGLNAPNHNWAKVHHTPVLDEHADIDIHAAILDNMLENSFKTAPDRDYTPLLTVVFCFFILRGFKNFRLNVIFTSILVFLYIIYYLYEYILGIYTALVPPIVCMYASVIFKMIYSSFTADETAEMFKHALGKYVSKDVMKKVMSNLDKLKLGGTRTNATIFFIDIRNFTKISEELTPYELTSILNEYFSLVEPVIAKYHGIVNKYIGDGMLAVFGEPVKTDEHAKNAVLCGIEILEKMHLLKEKFIKENKPVINAGIGVNTGEVFAGNIGTEERLEYTVIGDNVNLASRIEAYNQILKTQFLISEYTYEYVKDMVDVVKLSSVNIKGKSKPIDIYEVLRLKN